MVQQRQTYHHKDLRNALIETGIHLVNTEGTNKKLNNGLPILHKVPPKRDYGRYFCIMAEKGYYVNTVGENEAKIRKYIQEQEFNDQMCDQLSFS